MAKPFLLRIWENLETKEIVSPIPSILTVPCFLRMSLQRKSPSLSLLPRRTLQTLVSLNFFPWVSICLVELVVIIYINQPTIHLLYHINMYYIFHILCIALFQFTHSVILYMKPHEKKCFNIDHTPQKILNLKLSFREGSSRRCLFELRVITQNEGIEHELEKSEHGCPMGRYLEPYAFKHASEDEDYYGVYTICLTNLMNQNSETSINLYMGQKYRPQFYQSYNSKDNEIVYSDQLMQLKQIIRDVRISLQTTKRKMKHTLQNNKEIDGLINVSKNTAVFMSILECAIIVFSAGVWVVALFNLKKTFNK